MNYEQLTAIKQNQITMMMDRGYDIEQDEYDVLEYDVEEFVRHYKELNRQYRDSTFRNSIEVVQKDL